MWLSSHLFEATKACGYPVIYLRQWRHGSIRGLLMFWFNIIQLKLVWTSSFGVYLVVMCGSCRKAGQLDQYYLIMRTFWQVLCHLFLQSSQFLPNLNTIWCHFSCIMYWQGRDKMKGITCKKNRHPIPYRHTCIFHHYTGGYGLPEPPLLVKTVISSMSYRCDRGLSQRGPSSVGEFY